MKPLRKITTYITIIFLSLNTVTVFANVYDKKYYKKCKIGKEAKKLKDSFFNLPFVNTCDSNFTEEHGSSKVSTQRFYGNLNSFMSGFIRTNTDIDGEKTFNLIDKALRYELLLMNEEVLCNNGFGKVEAKSIPKCVENLSLNSDRPAFKWTLHNSDLIGSCDKKPHRRQKNSLFLNDLENFENLDPAKKKKHEEQLGAIFDSIRGAQALATKISDWNQGGSINHIREQLRGNNLEIFDGAISAINTLKELDPSFLVGADLRKFQIPVLDVAVAYIESKNNKKLDKDYLKVKAKKYFSHDSSNDTIRHAYQNPRNVLKENFIATGGQSHNQTPSQYGLIWGNMVNEYRDENLKDINKRFVNSITTLGHHGVHLRKPSKRNSSAANEEQKCQQCMEDLNCRDEMEKYKSNAGESRYPKHCRKKTGIMLSRKDRVVPQQVIDCKRRISAIAYSCGFDKNPENINQISSAPNVWAAKDNVQPFLKGNSLEDGVNDIFEGMRKDFDPKTFFSDLRKANINNMVAGMNDICDPSKVKFETLLQNPTLLNRFSNRNPSLTNKIGCFKEQSAKKNKEKEDWQETWGPITTFGCMALGVGTGIVSGAVTLGAGAIAAGAAADFACELYFGYHSYNNYISTSERKRQIEACNQLPGFIKDANQQECNATVAMINNHDSTISSIDIGLSILGGTLAIGGLAGAVSKLKSVDKPALSETINKIVDETYNEARRKGMNEIDARKLASKAVKEELKRLDEFKGYPDWFLEKLLTCK